LYQSSDVSAKATIGKINGGINSSTLVGIQPEYGRYLKIKMNNGKAIFVEPGYKCVTRELPDHILKKCYAVKDEIVLSLDSKQVRAKSPELYEWVMEGWKKE